jgi:parvulin-like peptidyl-prolyl isomerase
MRIPVHVLSILAISACGSGSKPKDAIVARVGTVPIRASEIQARAPALAPLVRGQVASTSTDLERRKYLLGILLKEEAMVQESLRRGYDRDPAVRSEMIARMLQDEVKASNETSGISDADVERYYLDHLEEMTKPKQVRVLQIFTRDRAVAEKAAAQARIGERSDIDAFQALVAKHSEDPVSRAYGGDMGFIDQKSSVYPKAVVDAAFALANLYDVSDAVPSERGFHVLKLVQRVPAYTPTPSEAAAEIRAQLKRLLVDRKRIALTKALQHRTQVQVDHEALLQVPLPSGLLSPPQ